MKIDISENVLWLGFWLILAVVLCALLYATYFWPLANGYCEAPIAGREATMWVKCP